MDIKLILADIDGTLLNTEKKVTPKTREAINTLNQKGIRFGIATGRSPYAVKNLVNEWGIGESTDLILGFNGGSTLDLHTMEMTSAFLLTGKAIPAIQKDFQGFEYTLGIYDMETFHCTKDDMRGRRTAAGNHFTFIEDDLSQYISSEVNKILLMAEPDEIVKIMKRYDKIQPSLYHAFPSGIDRLEIINPEISKSKGIAVLCEKYGYTKEQVVTVGDMMNDYEMIRDYIGVAMGNADQRVKDVAKYVTASNDEDGIALFIERYL